MVVAVCVQKKKVGEISPRIDITTQIDARGSREIHKINHLRLLRKTTGR